MRGGVTDEGQQQTNEQTVKIELLSQWKLEAEFRNSLQPMLSTLIQVDNQSNRLMNKSYLHLVEVGMLTSILIIFTFSFIIITITFIQTIVNIILLTITKLHPSQFSRNSSKTRLDHQKHHQRLNRQSAGGDLHHVQEEQSDKATNLSD